jgi:hypothetical protein
MTEYWKPLEARFPNDADKRRYFKWTDERKAQEAAQETTVSPISRNDRDGEIYRILPGAYGPKLAALSLFQITFLACTPMSKHAIMLEGARPTCPKKVHNRTALTTRMLKAFLSPDRNARVLG